MPWRGIFVVLAIYGAVMLVCTIFLIPETLPKARRSDKGSTTVLQRYKSVFSDRVFIGVLIIGAMTFSGLFSYLSASSFLFQQSLRLRRAAVRIALRGQLTRRRASACRSHHVSRRATARSGSWPSRRPCSCVAASAIIVFDQLGFGLWGTVIPLFVFMTACGFTFPCVQVLALDRHGKAAGTAASLIGATNFGIAGSSRPSSAGSRATPASRRPRWPPSWPAAR